MRDKDLLQDMVRMDDYIRIQEQLKQKIKKLEDALAIKNTLVSLMENENNGLREQLGDSSKIIINSNLVKTIEKTLEQLLIDIPIKDLSKIQIKEVLEGILDTIENESKQVWKFAQA